MREPFKFNIKEMNSCETRAFVLHDIPFRELLEQSWCPVSTEISNFLVMNIRSKYLINQSSIISSAHMFSVWEFSILRLIIENALRFRNQTRRLEVCYQSRIGFLLLIANHKTVDLRAKVGRFVWLVAAYVKNIPSPKTLLNEKTCCHSSRRLF